MRNVEYLAPTPRSKMTKARAAKIFLARNGVCWKCQLQIRASRWTVEHPDALALSGSDDDDDLWPIHEKCVAAKNASDAAAIAKRNRIVAYGYVGPGQKRAFPGSRRDRFKRRMDGTTVERET